MTEILIACDKFKGSATAEEACNALSRGILRVRKDVVSMCHPMADGGEGSLSVLQSDPGMRTRKVTIQGPTGDLQEAVYGISGKTAFIETAAACGLQLVHLHQRDPGKTTTYGVGMLIRDALEQGCDEVHLFLGGSATTDGGAGMAAALGYRFIRDNGSSFIPTGNSLTEIRTVLGCSTEIFDPNVRFHAWCDVDIPMLGPKGAVMMFAAQKGAGEDQLPALEAGMQHVSSVFESQSRSGYSPCTPGSGAAGGLGAGCVFFLGASLNKGTQFIIDATGLAHKIQKADIVVSGEGSLDHQSLQGKVVSAIGRLCRKYQKPFVIVAGKSILNENEIISLGVQHVFELVSGEVSEQEAMTNATAHLEHAGARIAGMLEQ
jgi:glycerate kinase